MWHGVPKIAYFSFLQPFIKSLSASNVYDCMYFDPLNDYKSYSSFATILFAMSLSES